MIRQQETVRHLRNLDPESFFHAYGVDLQMLYPWQGVVEPPFGAAWATLAPRRSTKSHQHQEAETFFIARGHGRMTIDDESFDVEEGSVIFQRPFEQHVLYNESDSEDLLFLTVWWEDRELWSARDELASARETPPPVRRRVMVTAAPPTPNGDLHLGHLAGPYLGADFHTRYLRLRGVDSVYACGSDDHCMYVERRGEELGMNGEEAMEHFAAAITDSLQRSGVEMAFYLRPDESEAFAPRVAELFKNLYHAGEIEVRKTPSPYCESCARYLFEADIEGRCPHCERAITGNTCEECGRINDCIDLLDARCTGCGGVPEARACERLFFPLGRHAERLSDYHRRTAMNARLRSFCERHLADGLPDVAISHPSSWGLPVPLDGTSLDRGTFAGQKLYVWFEMAARYLVYAEHLAPDPAMGLGHYWKDEEATIVQFFGVDNSFYYALLLPALYLAYDEKLRPPTAFVTNEFYRLDGEKFSTTRNHAILARELLGRASRDAVRFYLAYSAPEREGTSFTLAEFAATTARELSGWELWLHDLGEKMRRELDGDVPATGDWTAEHRDFFASLELLISGAAAAYEAPTFSPQRASRLLCELVRQARRFGKTEDHWRGVPDREQERRTGLALELLAARALAVLAYPIMPDFATCLWRDLGYPDEPPAGAWEDLLSWLPASQRLGALGEEPYFADLETVLRTDEKTAGVTR